MLTLDDLVTGTRSACAMLADLIAAIETEPATPDQIELALWWYANWNRHLAAETPLAGVPDADRREVAQTLAVAAVAFDLAVNLIARRELIAPDDARAAARAFRAVLEGIALDVARAVVPAPVA
jgi:hypothetical protein